MFIHSQKGHGMNAYPNDCARIWDQVGTKSELSQDHVKILPICSNGCGITNLMAIPGEALANRNIDSPKNGVLRWSRYMSKINQDTTKAP
ncbi:MAG: hypothetical protein P1R74_16330, partial [Sedimenticola sp.]|nr:hypothetical protein [Sedimenticola sp.]